jgi:hypothetical protein
MNIFAGESDVKKHSQKTSERDGEPRQCYVYEIRIDGVVRYIGKGRNGRIYSHLIDAKRTASRSEVKIGNLSPHFRKMLVSAVRRGLNIAEVIVASNLTDGEAYTIEQEMIGNYHRRTPASCGTRSTSVSWTQNIFRRNGRTRSIRCTEYHDR